MQEVMIRIPDDAFVTAEKQARRDGFGSTEVYLSDLVVSNLALDPDNYDHLFTPTVLAAIERGAQDARDGKTLSREEVKASIAEERAKWITNHGN